MKSLLRAWWAKYLKQPLPSYFKIKNMVSNFGSVTHVAPK